MDTLGVFFDLITRSIGRNNNGCHKPSDKEWLTLYKMSCQQAVAGLMFLGIEKLPKDKKPPLQLLLEWYAMKEQIAAQNRLLNKRTAEACRFFKKNGFDNVILKGQGVAQLYPHPECRTPGDIDIWVAGGREKIYEFARKKGPLEGVNYHHIHYHLFDDVEVEVHNTPSDLNNPFDNRKLQHYFKGVSPALCNNTLELEEGKITVPTDEFNVFFILLHIYHHYLNEGIGLRQIIDYYYVLKNASKESKESATKRIKEFRMARFARGIMWILHDILGLEEEYLILEPDKKRGQVILDEVLVSGNFGHYDPRINRKMKSSAVGRMISSTKGLARKMSEHPSEILWNIPFRFGVWFWRSFLLKK